MVKIVTSKYMFCLVAFDFTATGYSIQALPNSAALVAVPAELSYVIS